MNSKLLTVLVGLVALSGFAQQKPAYTDAEAGKHVGEEATVTGKLANISTSGKGMTFLNIGDRFPRQVFSGVVFSRNEAAVGDLKQYEGKEVALTGRIELSPSQKPQIVINRADQIKLANAPASPAAPTPAPVPPTAPAPAVAMVIPPSQPATTPPVELPLSKPYVSKPRGKIALAMNWSSPGQGGEMARKDLAKLFGGHGSASESADVDTSVEVYPKVLFLASLADAKKILHLEGVASSKVKISTPGLPQGSFSSYTFAGVFAGGYTRIYLITDGADQVVSVLLVDANTGARAPNEIDTTGYHTYNFITGGAKATNELVIKHQINSEAGIAGVVVVDSMLVDTKDNEFPAGKSAKGKTSTFNKPKTGKVLERSRWFVPVPLVNLILRSVAQ